MNNKGFTLIEAILSFSLVTVILISLVAVTINYRERVDSEEIVTLMGEFKNSITKMVYDDIILDDYENLKNSDKPYFNSITCCGTNSNNICKCAKFNRSDGTSTKLGIVNCKKNTSGPPSCISYGTSICGNKPGIYLNYENEAGSHCIHLPDSELNDPNSLENIDEISIYSSRIVGFSFDNETEGINEISIPIQHRTAKFNKDITISLNN